MRADDDHRENHGPEKPGSDSAGARNNGYENAGSDNPEEVFRALRDRETPELDSEAAWRRLRAALPERAPAPGLPGWVPGWGVGWGAGWRTGWGAAAAAATVALAVALVLWQGWGAVPSDAERVLEPADGVVAGGVMGAEDAGEPSATPGEPTYDDRADGDRGDQARDDRTEADRRLVLLADAVPEGEEPPADAPEGALTDASADASLGAVPDAVAPMRLDVRLLREGMAHDPALGAGGADPTADIGATLEAVLPDRDYGILGRWQGDLGEGAMQTELAPGYRLAFEVDPDDPRTLRRVRLIGDLGPLVADEIRLELGQVYLFGVRDADGNAADVLLAMRLRPAVPAQPDGPDQDR